MEDTADGYRNRVYQDSDGMQQHVPITLADYDAIEVCQRPGCGSNVLFVESFVELGMWCEAKRCICGNIVYRPLVSQSPALDRCVHKRKKYQFKAKDFGARVEAIVEDEFLVKDESLVGKEHTVEEDTNTSRQGRATLAIHESRQVLRMYEARDEGGKKLTNQTELAERFGVSVTTIKRALRRAKDERNVSRNNSLSWLCAESHRVMPPRGAQSAGYHGSMLTELQNAVVTLQGLQDTDIESATGCLTETVIHLLALALEYEVAVERALRDRVSVMKSAMSTEQGGAS